MTKVGNEPAPEPAKPEPTPDREKRMVEMRMRFALFLLPTALLGAFLFLSEQPRTTETDPTKVVLAWLKQAPTDETIYFFGAVLIGMWLVSRRNEQSKIDREIAEHKDCTDLSPRHWWVVRTLRQRAARLRTSATTVLVSLLVLLLGGLYTTVLLLPDLLLGERRKIEEEKEAIEYARFKERFEDSLDLMVEGRYWLKLRIPKSEGKNAGQYQKVAFSEDGSLGVLSSEARSGETGPILITRDKGKSWSRMQDLGLEPGHMEDLALEPGHWMGTAVFRTLSDTPTDKGMIVSQKGGIFVTEDGGESWKKGDDNLLAENGEDWITTSWLSEDARTQRVTVVGHQGTVLSTTDWGRTWCNWGKSKCDCAQGGQTACDSAPLIDTELDGGAISAAAFSDDGGTGVIGRYKGKVLLTTNGGTSWQDINGGDPRLLQNGWLSTAAFSADGNLGLIAGVSGEVFRIAIPNGNAQQPIEINLQNKEKGEGIVAVALNAQGREGIIVGTKGSVFVTKDIEGSEWAKQEKLSLKSGEELHDASPASFSPNARHGVIAANAQSVFVTVDGGRTWKTTRRHDNDQAFRSIASVTLDAGKGLYGAVALDAGGSAYLLERHDDLRGWRQWPLAKVVAEVGRSTLRSQSEVVQEMRQFNGQGTTTKSTGSTHEMQPAAPTGPTTSAESANGGMPRQNEQKPEAPEPASWQAVEIQTTILRIVTLTVLFFLVQLLVRLYQYNLRLAAFWESRSDAVLLADRFAEGKAKTFDQLVHALAPDTYDFKGLPQSMLNRVRGRSREKEG